MTHPWQRCRFGGCGDCCSCGEDCKCTDSFTTAEDLIAQLSLLDPKTRIVLSGEDEYTYYDIGDLGLCALKPYTTEFVYRVRNDKGEYGAPEGAEQCRCIHRLGEV